MTEGRRGSAIEKSKHCPHANPRRGPARPRRGATVIPLFVGRAPHTNARQLWPGTDTNVVLGSRCAARWMLLASDHARSLTRRCGMWLASALYGNSDAEILEARRRAARPCLGGSEWRNRLSVTCTQPVVCLGLIPDRKSTRLNSSH